MIGFIISCKKLTHHYLISQKAAGIMEIKIFLLYLQISKITTVTIIIPLIISAIRRSTRINLKILFSNKENKIREQILYKMKKKQMLATIQTDSKTTQKKLESLVLSLINKKKLQKKIKIKNKWQSKS